MVKVISKNIINVGQFKKGHIPYTKLHPEICKENSGSFKKGQIPWNRGKKGLKDSEETKTRKSESAKKSAERRIKTRKKNGWWKNPEETKKRQSGKTPYNKDKKGVFHHTEETKRKIGLNGYHQGMKGKKQSAGTIQKIILTRKWYKPSVETRRKIGEANKGKICSEETKQKLREWNILHPNNVFKDTKIELKIEKELQKRNISYKKQISLCEIALVDFYLPDYEIIIQCDGCYWHNCLIHYPNDHFEARIRDFGQDVVLKANGFKIYRFWEHEINESVEKCINNILL